MRIRPLSPTDDFGALTALIHRAYAPLAEQGLHYWATHQSEADTVARCAKGETWVAEGEHGPVGLVTLAAPGSGGCPWYAHPQVAHFNQLAVDPAVQGHGVAAALMGHIEGRAAQMGAAELACDTSERADRLIATYERRGYRFVGDVDWRPEVNYRSVLLSRRSDGTARPATLWTERLCLRAVGLRDAPAIQKHFNNWNIIRHLSTAVPWPYPKDGARRYLQDLVLPATEQGTMTNWAICLRESPESLIGLIGYRQPQEMGDRGFWLAEPHWGTGLMTEAVVATQDHLFFEQGLGSIRMVTATDNPASQRVKEKSGAVRVGTTRCGHHEGGDDAEAWVVTRERWAAIRGRDEPHG
jgi:[ribosomal protein S5]-alanine N-acetyltransferase